MLVEPVALPLLRVKGPMPAVELTLGLAFDCRIKEASPVGVPLPDVTPMLKLTDCPWVSVVRVAGGVADSKRVAAVVVKSDFHLFTRFATLTVPNPVAKSYPAVVGNAAELPDSTTPNCPDAELLLLQFAVPP
jgi:hypothetical protein